MDKKRKKSLIIVAYASTGSGHQMAAQAIFEQLSTRKSTVEVKLVDILDYYSGNLDGNDFVSATSGFLAPLFDIAWRKNFTGKILWSGGKFWPSLLYWKFENLIAELKPDSVICTHFVCANSAVKARLSMSKYFPIVCVPTDYETEGLWPHKHADLFCVANNQMRLTLLARNVDDNNIVVSGIPLCKCFKKSYDKRTALKKFNLPIDKKIAVIVAGANLAGPYKNIRKIINGCLKYFAKMSWMHFVICAGKDNEYAKKIKDLIDTYNAKNIEVINYSENMTQLLSAADVALVKPGGLITTECACIGLPIILLGKSYAQENVNRRYLTIVRAAEHAITYKGVVNLLCDIFTDQNRYNNLKANCKEICNDKAAQIIVSNTIQIKNLKKKPYNKWFPLYFGQDPVHTR